MDSEHVGTLVVETLAVLLVLTILRLVTKVRILPSSI